MYTRKLVFIISILFLASGTISAQDFDYIGAAKCKMCHNKAAKGQQYKLWSAGPHANAMKSLSSEKSLEYAKANGIEDPTKEPSCIKCHSTVGSTDPSLHAGLKITEGVSCETCHGPGSAYKSKTTMLNRKKSLAKGLILPTKEVCEECHNEENPFHKPFNYEEYKAKIAHPIPAAE